MKTIFRASTSRTIKSPQRRIDWEAIAGLAVLLITAAMATAMIAFPAAWIMVSP
jgi:hypothetical protein